MFDLLIKGAEIYDGSGGEAYTADLAISDDKIAGIGIFEETCAKKCIDARGLCLFPGLIDTHTHSDIALLNAPERTEAVLQGVTSEIISACGIGVLPMTSGRNSYLKSVTAITGTMTEEKPFTNLTEYAAAVGKSGTNYGVQVPHSPLRVEAVGFCDVPVGKKEMDRLKGLLKESLEEGACAFSTGLAYYPASFCDTAELVELCKVAAEYDVPFCTHLRSVINRYFDKNTFDATEEALEIAQKSGVHLHFSHRRTVQANVGQVASVLSPIIRGNQAGFQVTADFYPYPVGAGYVAVYLPLSLMNGDLRFTLSHLNTPEKQAAVGKEMEERIPNLADGIFIHAPKHPDYVGHSYAEVIAETGESVGTMLARFLYEEELDGGYRPHITLNEEQIAAMEKDFAEIIKSPYYMVGSDTLPLQMMPHPRSCGTFPKMLRIAREQRIPLSLMANRLCKNPATVFGMKKRGEIKKGYFADITLFDKNTVCERNSFADTTKAPTGIPYVIVGGKLAVEKGKATGALGGGLVKRNQ